MVKKFVLLLFSAATLLLACSTKIEQNNYTPTTELRKAMGGENYVKVSLKIVAVV